jgi:hypothetical protein
MSWLGGFRLPSVPEPVGGGPSSMSRLAGRQPQPYANRPSPVSVGRAPSQQPRLSSAYAAANATVLGADPRLATSRLSTDSGPEQVRARGARPPLIAAPHRSEAPAPAAGPSGGKPRGAPQARIHKQLPAAGAL